MYNESESIIYEGDYGISLDEVAACIGDVLVNENGDIDLAATCLSDKINMMSKNKPIDYDTWEVLTEEQRKGTAEDNRNNIYYGVKIENLPTSAVLDDRLADMHLAKFTYIKPTNKFRLLDFDGYKHNAVPNPYASFQSDNNKITGFYNDENLAMGGINGITVQYRENDQYGINFAEILAGAGESLSDVLDKAYPCILITDEDGRSFFTALSVKGEDGSLNPSKLVRNGELINETWCVKIDKPVKSPTSVNGGSSTPPWSGPQTGMKATLFLLESASIYEPVIRAFGDNFHDNWIQAESGGVAATRVPIVLPGAVGLELELKQYYSGIIFQPIEVKVNINENKPVFSVSFQETTGGSSNNNIQISVYLSLDNGYTTYISREFNGWPSPFATEVFIPVNDLLHAPNTTYSGKVYIVTKDGNATNTSNVFKFSQTVQ